MKLKSRKVTEILLVSSKTRTWFCFVFHVFLNKDRAGATPVTPSLAEKI